jgi:hypothetical protein
MLSLDRRRKKLYRTLDFGPGLCSLSVAAVLLLVVGVARADLLFEGYYKVISAGVPVGYYVQNYEYDAKKKQFISRYYIRTNALGGNLAESLIARADEKYFPISYQYTANADGLSKTIDATFKRAGPSSRDQLRAAGSKKSQEVASKRGAQGGVPEDHDAMVMNATMTEGGQRQVIDRRLPKGAFLSTFLGYLMLQKGLSPNTKFDYVAIAEEDGKTYEGSALVKESVTERDFAAYRIINSFKGARFVSVITVKGEVLSTRSPLQQLATELVAVPVEATAQFPYLEQTLRLIFGRVPDGKKNALAERRLNKLESLAAPAAPAPAPAKAPVSAPAPAAPAPGASDEGP